MDTAPVVIKKKKTSTYFVCQVQQSEPAASSTGRVTQMIAMASLPPSPTGSCADSPAHGKQKSGCPGDLSLEQDDDKQCKTSAVCPDASLQGSDCCLVNPRGSTDAGFTSPWPARRPAGTGLAWRVQILPERGFYLSKAGASLYLCLRSIRRDRDPFLVRTLKLNSDIPGIGQGGKKENTHNQL